MRLKSILIFLLFSAFVNTGYAQNSSNEFIKQWDDLLKGDDNEKDFQFYAFLESVKANLLMPETVISTETIPATWNLVVSNDLSTIVCSGILPFQYQKNRLIVFVVENGQNKLAHVFSRNIDITTTEIPKPEISLEKTETGYALKVFAGQSLFLDIPDLSVKILLSRLKSSRIDTEKDDLSNQIWTQLHQLIASEVHYKNKFEGYDEFSTILSSDGKIKLCTWNVEYNDGTNKFFGWLAVNTSSGIKTFKLLDNYQSIRTPEQASLTPSKWYGALYYDIVETKSKGTLFYTLMGYNGNDAFSQIKVIDVLVISEGNNPNPRFGHPIFTDEKRTRRRLVFEYSNRATMMLRYDATLKMIVMDNLAPIEPIYQDDFRYYGPDFSYNALKFEKGKWVLIPEVDLRNPAPGRK